MIVGSSEILSDGGVQLVSRYNIQHHNLRGSLGIIKGHAMRNPSSAVVPDNRKTIESQILHQLHLIASHGPFRVPLVVVAIGRLTAIAIAPEICCDNRKAFRQ